MRRHAILAVAIVAALLLGSAPAAAACRQRWETRLPCASGEFTGEWVGEDDLERPATWISGWIEPCGTAGASERFGFVYYVQDRDGPAPRGYVIRERLREYAPNRTYFAGTVDPAVEEHNGNLIAICLAYAPGRPVACLQPRRPTEEGPPRPPLPPIRELAALQVSLTAPFGPEPNCATCV